MLEVLHTLKMNSNGSPFPVAAEKTRSNNLDPHNPTRSGTHRNVTLPEPSFDHRYFDQCEAEHASPEQ